MSAPTIEALPGYRIVRELGRGGMATVYLAIQESFGREVAVKVMSPALLTDPSFGERFLREARIVAQLSHPNIVQVYDVGVHGDHHYLTMEYLAEGELNDRLARGLEVEEVFRVSTDVARALHFAHRKGYIHRDIKPENILFREEGSAVLSDFGIARAVDSSTQMTRLGSVIGTPHYMSPEQAEGKDLDGRSDIYSLGVVFYKMLTGQVPFEAESAVAIGIRHITDPIPTLPPHLSAFQPVLDRFLAKDREQRFQDGQEVIDALAELQRGGVVPAAVLKTEIIGTAEIEAVRRSAEQSALRGGTAAGARTELATRIEPGQTTTVGGTLVPRRRGSPWPWLSAGVLLAAAAAGGLWYWQEVMGRPPPWAAQEQPAPAATAAQDPAATAAAERAAALQQRRNRAQALAAAAQPDLAAEAAAWQAVLELEPEAQDARRALGDLAVLAALAVQDRLQQGDLEAASGMLDRAQALLPDQAPLVDAAQRLAARQGVDTLLERADAYLADNALMEPAGASAFALYQQALDRQPGNQRALDGLSAIAAAYAALSSRALQRGDLDAATTWVERGALADGEHPDLRAARTAISGLRERRANHAQLLARAGVLLGQDALVAPADGNAAALYRQVLAEHPGSTAAAEGLDAVATALAERAVARATAGDLGRAQADLAAARALQRPVQALDAAAAAVEQAQAARGRAETLLADARALAAEGYLSGPGERHASRLLAQARDLAPDLPGLADLTAAVADRLAAVAAEAHAAGLADAAAGYVERTLALVPEHPGALAVADALASAPAAPPEPDTAAPLTLQPSTPAAPAAPPSQVASLGDLVTTLVASSNPMELLPAVPPPLQSGFTRLYVGFEHRGFRPGSVLSAVLRDGARAVELKQVPVIITAADGVKKFQVDRPVEGFATGSYAIDLLLEGTVVASLEFRVGD